MTKLESARKKVNELEFGTKEWDEAMDVVRSIVEDQDSKTEFGRHDCESDGKWWV